MNVDRIVANPSDISFGQLDVAALKIGAMTEKKPVLVRSLGSECLFAVSRNPDLKNYGDIAGLARRLPIVMPPKTSGASGTLEYLKSIDPEGMGQARNITYTDSVDAALEEVLKPDSKAVTFFVQAADPENPRFKAINEKGGFFIPVIDRTVLRQKIGDVSVYEATETSVSNPNWTVSQGDVTTACTPLMVMTGDPKDLPEGSARLDQEDLIKTIQKFDASILQPKVGIWSSLMNKVKKLSSTKLAELEKLAEDGRQKANNLLQ